MTLIKPSWSNQDGLQVYFGTTEGTAGLGGEYKNIGPTRIQEFTLLLTDLTTNAQYLDQHFELPKGALLEQVEVETLVAATSGGAATLNIGLKQSDQVTNISDTAVVNALALASFSTVGTKLVLNVGSTGAGSSIGVALTVNGLLTAKWGTAAFTAGKVIVRLVYNFAK